MREREVYMLYEMNKESHNEIVKQGTIFGPKLCSVATEKINGIGEERNINTHHPRAYYRSASVCR